ncbi:hypothetical protein [Amycolatopsis sp. lyj-112]|uniref:hypothetical protein n=1 Tax=Amycolatopsis sp. lyj-112 TaxID=2789288 RepID=UPI003979C33C
MPIDRVTGLAIGSVRHYFNGHDELLVFAMRALGDRLEARLLRHIPHLLDPATPRARPAGARRRP